MGGGGGGGGRRVVEGYGYFLELYVSCTCWMHRLDFQPSWMHNEMRLV